MMNKFYPQALDDDQIHRASKIRDACAVAHELIEALPAGVEKDMASSKLREASMWGVAAVAHHTPHPDPV